ncbi:serine/threonine exchanger SteT [Collibacillus ludicampi]|uniref:Serine/threonine exchanger SteT n=1 Tax=Collibacillus ludicampi TaxID=2771369 RepID=A0AAV4LBV0_9BACL|nr:amino acid permease [Collibacillus ludicampi]GIM45272.1 serine/threonine exchanger SteT [Collibacillus ludicampi]
MNNLEGQLRKEIGLTVSISIVIGTVIGSGIFMKPGKVIASAGDPSMALLAWVLGGLLTLAAGLTIAEVSTQIPKTGGLYVYLEEVYGKIWGFMSGWVQTIIYGPAVIGALGLYFGSLVIHMFGMADGWKTSIGIAAIVFLAVMNSLGAKWGGWIQTAATLGKLMPIALIAIFGIWKGHGQLWNTGELSSQTNMGVAILATLWAYDGWILIGLVAGEMKNPAKMLPRAIIGGLAVVIVAYLSVNVALLHVLSADQIVALGDNAASQAASLLFGEIGGKLIPIGILISIFGCLNGKIFTFPRIPFAMAERAQLPFSRVLSKVHERFGTPVFAILLETMIAILLMLLGNPDRLSDIAIFAIYIFYIQAFLAAFILRKRNPGKARIYSVPLYPITPILAIIGSGYVIVSTVMTNPSDTMFAIALTLIGLPLYLLLNRSEAQILVDSPSNR